MEATMTDEWVRIATAAQELSEPHITLYRWAKAGVLPYRARARIPGGRRVGPGSTIEIRRRDIPACRLMFAVQRALGPAGATMDLLSRVRDHYREGRLDLDGFALTWEVEDGPR